MKTISPSLCRSRSYLLSLDCYDDQTQSILLEYAFDALSQESFSKYLELLRKHRSDAHALQVSLMAYILEQMPCCDRWQAIDVFTLVYRLTCKLASLIECGGHTRLACAHINCLGVMTIEADFDVSIDD